MTGFSEDRLRTMPSPSYSYLKSSTEQGVLVLTILAVKIQDEAMGETLRQEFLTAMADAEAPKIVIDFQNVHYVSSVAFRPLLHLRQKLQERGGEMVLCGLSASIGDVFYTTRLASSSGSVAAPFRLEPDVAAAVRWLNQSEEGNP
jgi:anti-anti-sigma factor